MKALKTLLALGFVASLAVAEQQNPNNAPPPPAQAPQGNGQATNTPVQPPQPPPGKVAEKPREETNPVEAQLKKRDEFIFQRLKELVKHFDAANRKESPFPEKTIETALRSEFMYRTDGNVQISWHPGAVLNYSDKLVALDNLDLLIDYSEKLLWLSEHGPRRSKKMAKKSKEPQVDWESEMKLLAVKMAIDEQNSALSQKLHRGIASLEHGTMAPGPIGRQEWARHKKLLAGLVAGEDYTGFQVARIDDIGKRFKEVLQLGANEYVALASQINRGVEKKARAATRVR